MNSEIDSPITENFKEVLILDLESERTTEGMARRAIEIIQKRLEKEFAGIKLLAEFRKEMKAFKGWEYKPENSAENEMYLERLIIRVLGKTGFQRKIAVEIAKTTILKLRLDKISLRNTKRFKATIFDELVLIAKCHALQNGPAIAL